MTLDLGPIKERIKAAICPECDGKGSIPAQPGCSVFCPCGTGLTCAGEESMMVDFALLARDLLAEVERLRAVRDAAAAYVGLTVEHDGSDAWCVANERLRAALRAAEGGA